MVIFTINGNIYNQWQCYRFYINNSYVWLQVKVAVYLQVDCIFNINNALKKNKKNISKV